MAIAPLPAAVRVAEVRIQDFRVIRDCCVTLESGTTVLVGENNTGKSSFFQAMEAAIGRRQSTEDDLHRSPTGASADRFEVDLRIVPLQGEAFDDEISGAYGAGVIQPPPADGREYVAIRTVGRLNPDGGPLRTERSYLQGWARTRADATGIPVMNSPRYMSPAIDLIQFFLLDAARDLVGELRNRNSAWGRSVVDLGLAAADRTELNDRLAALGADISARSPILETLRASLDRIRELIASGVSSTAIAAIPRDVSELPRSMDVLVQAPGSAALPLRLQGMGGRSLASLMIFQAFVEVRLAQQVISPLSLSAFEEPEAHLHPQAQRAVAHQIDSIGGQKLVSTHSPFVAGSSELSSLRVLTRQGDSITVRRLEATLSTDDQTLVRRLLQRRGGEALFARMVVLVEGESEEAALSTFGEAHWAGALKSLGLSIVAVDGAQGFALLVSILDQLGIAWVILVDGDAEGNDALVKVGGRLGRQVDRNSPGIFQLPPGESFEEHLSRCGLVGEIEQGIAARFGGNALEQYGSSLNGTSYGKNKVNRDYTSQGGHERLIRDFLSSKKGQYGRAVAEAVCSVPGPDGLPKMPQVVRDLFIHVEAVLS